MRYLGGRIVRSDDGFVVQGVESNLITPAILAALVTHRSDLEMLVPSPPTGEGRRQDEGNGADDKAQADRSDVVLSDEELRKGLESM